MSHFIEYATFSVSVGTFLVLVWYTYETFKIRKAAQQQIAVSQDLLKAANDQAEGVSKPCLTLRGQLRSSTHAILDMDDAVGTTIVNDDSGHYVVVNIGSGVALNVEFTYKIFPPDGSAKQLHTHYLQTVRPGQDIALPLLVNVYGEEQSITFRYQSLGGRWYESTVTIKSKVLTGLRFEEVGQRQEMHQSRAYQQAFDNWMARKPIAGFDASARPSREELHQRGSIR